MSQPIITPRKFLHAIYGRDSLPPELAECTCAVVAFCQFHDMQRKLAAEPVPTSLFSLLHQTHQFIGHIAGRTILALENVQGGPLAATVVEELAHYGITQVLGYGYAGSLTRTVPIGQLVLAEEALISDGTSRAYLMQVPMPYAAPHTYCGSTAMAMARAERRCPVRCDLEPSQCPHPVRRTREAARLPCASEPPARGRGRTRSPGVTIAAGRGASAGVPSHAEGSGGMA
jgi:Phosphorylase superfamily